MAHFQGPRTLKRTIRPPRVVYVVQTIEHCDAALQKCSVTWGGKQFCIVPYSPEYGFSEDWLKLIARYDPDSILTFPVLSAAAIDQLSEHAVFKISDLIDDERKGYAGPRSLLAASEQLLAVGQSIYAALASMDPPATGLKFRDVVIPHPNSEYEWRRYERAAFGYFDETTGHLAELFRREELRQDLRLKDIINVSYLEQDHDFIHHSIETSLASDKLSLIDYTLMQLSPQVSGRSLLQIGDRSIVHDEQNLLFVSDGISIDDFCWFWCLRSQRYPPPSWLPLWLPIELFEQHANTIRKRLPPRDRTFLISCSVNQTDLGKLAAKLNRNVEPTSSELYRFFDDKFVVGIEDQCDVVFDRGTATIPIPRSDVVQSVRDFNGFYYVDVELPDYTLPRLDVELWGTASPTYTRYRVSRTGPSFWYFKTSGPFLLNVPTPRQILETVAEVKGYNVASSDKGVIASGVLDILGGAANIWLISGEATYQLLYVLAAVSQSEEFRRRLTKIARAADIKAEPGDIEELTRRVLQALTSEHHERVWMQASELRQSLRLNSRYSDQLLKWMVSRRLLFRGEEVRCPLCGTYQWLHVDDIAATMKCMGCQQVVDTPLQITSTTWKYRLNRLVASAVEQGLVPHLLSVFYFLDSSRPALSADDTIVGPWYGLRFQRQGDLGQPVADIEVDIAWLQGGGIFVGECKTKWRDLTLSEVERLADFARHLGCRKLVLSAPDEEENLDPQIIDFLGGLPIDHVILGKNALLNQYPRRQRDLLGGDGDSDPGGQYQLQLQRFLDHLEHLAHVDRIEAT